MATPAPTPEQPQRNFGGRPSKLTDQLCAALAEDLATGTYSLANIARTHRIHRVTLWRWLDIGKHRPDTRYGELVRAIKNARRRFLRRNRRNRFESPAIALAHELLAARERRL